MDKKKIIAKVIKKLSAIEDDDLELLAEKTRDPKTLEMLAKDENAIIIDSPSTEQWSKHLTGLLSRPDFARQLGLRGRKTVIESFAASSQIEGLLDTFQKVLSGDAYSFA